MLSATIPWYNRSAVFFVTLVNHIIMSRDFYHCLYINIVLHPPVFLQHIPRQYLTFYIKLEYFYEMLFFYFIKVN